MFRGFMKINTYLGFIILLLFSSGVILLSLQYIHDDNDSQDGNKNKGGFKSKEIHAVHSVNNDVTISLNPSVLDSLKPVKVISQEAQSSNSESILKESMSDDKILEMARNAYAGERPYISSQCYKILEVKRFPLQNHDLLNYASVLCRICEFEKSYNILSKCKLDISSEYLNVALLIALNKPEEACKALERINSKDELILLARLYDINKQSQKADALYMYMQAFEDINFRRQIAQIWFFKSIDDPSSKLIDKLQPEICKLIDKPFEYLPPEILKDNDSGMVLAVTLDVYTFVFNIFFKENKTLDIKEVDGVYTLIPEVGEFENKFVLIRLSLLGDGELFSAIGDAYYIKNDFVKAKEYYNYALEFPKKGKRSVGIYAQIWASYMLRKIELNGK